MWNDLKVKNEIEIMSSENKNTIQVAIIDDNTPLRNISAKQLEQSGFSVLFQADDGHEALQKIKENNKLPDVCVIEQDFKTVKILLQNYPDLKVLVSCMNDDKESVTDMLKTGVSGYILKYADPDEMITAVKALTENKKYFSLGISEIATEYFKNRVQ